MLRYPDGVAVGGTPGSRAVSEDAPNVDALAARRETDAPMMREVLRMTDVTAPIDLTVSADACFRAIVAGPPGGALRAWFEDGARAPRGGVAIEAGLVPPRGPACARRGETLRFVVDRAASRGHARVVIWQAP